MEATTQETTEGATSQETPEVVEETATKDGEAETPINLDDVPANLRPAVEKKIRDMELGFKRAYTQKTQSLSAKERERDLELSTVRQQNQQFQAIVNDIRANPKKIDHYVALLTGNQPEQKEAPQFQTVGELMEYVENKMSTHAVSVEQKASQKAEEKIREFQRVQRWETTLDKLRIQDPKFKKYEDLVVMKAMKEPKYTQLYTGDNEHVVLSAALDDFKNLIREDIDGAKQETLAGMKNKKLANSSMPKKTLATEGGPLTKEEIIARVNAALPR